MKRPIAFHPVLIAAAPVLFLWSQNANEVGTRDVVGPLLWTVGIAALGFLGLALALRDHRRGALAASVISVLFLTFGYWREMVSVPPDGLLVIGGVLAAAAIGAAIVVGALEDLTKLLNGIGVILVVVAAVPAITHHVASRPAEASSSEVLAGAEANDATTRDIYYIVLDRYAREDTLREMWSFDNSAFLGFLEETGFVLPEQSVTNYPKTAHSIATSLNMQYLQNLIDVEAADGNDWAPVYTLMRKHAVGTFLKEHGYRYIHVGNWFDPLESSPIADENLRFDDDTEFGTVYEQTTAWPTIRRTIGLPGPPTGRDGQRASTLYQLDTLDRLAQRRDDTPEFVFAEITLPHGPFTLDAEGNHLTREQERSRSRREGYLGHLQYANTRMRGFVSAALDGPDETDPIIILQSDEGPNADRMEDDPRRIPEFDWTAATLPELIQKMRILNAYYLPGADTPEIPPTITPVNSFRVVFDTYFGTDFGMLPDRAYVYTDEHHLYDFTEVTGKVQQTR